MDALAPHRSNRLAGSAWYQAGYQGEEEIRLLSAMTCGADRKSLMMLDE
jgi:hypothetical protein